MTAGRKGRRRFLALFASLIGTLLIFPYAEDRAFGGAVLLFLFTAVVASAVYGAGGSRGRVLFAIALGAPWMAASWSYLLAGYTGLLAPGYASAVLFNAWAVYGIVRRIAEAERVTGDLIFGAISAYLLIGIAFGFLYAGVEHFRAGSILFQHAHRADGALTWSDFVYFSFVSLTSTGYGDAAPVASQARSLAIVEMVIGLLYPAVLIARLVGLYSREEES